MLSWPHNPFGGEEKAFEGLMGVIATRSIGGSLPKCHGSSYKQATRAEAKRSFLVGVRDFIKSMGSVIRLSKKSNKEQFFLYLKLVILGVGVVGTLGFLIKLLSTVLPTIFG